MKRRAIETIIAISSTGTPKRRNGPKMRSIASVSSIIDEVKVSNEQMSTSNTMRRAKKRPLIRPSSVMPKLPKSTHSCVNPSDPAMESPGATCEPKLMLKACTTIVNARMKMMGMRPHAALATGTCAIM